MAEEETFKENGSRHEGRSHALRTSLIEAITLFERVQRKFHPAMMGKHGELLARKGESLQREMKDFLSENPEPGAGTVEGILLEAAALVGEAVLLFNRADGLEAGVFNAMRAGRKICRAYEILFPLRHEIREIENLFRENIPGQERSLDRKENERIVHMGSDGETYARGRASLYVPEPPEGLQTMPLIVALHGGYGHGRDFLWTWIREARTRRFLLLAPTSQGNTWSLGDLKTDLAPLADLVERVAGEHPVDRERILLSGLSDGATFALGCAMQPDSPFSAFNPVCGVLPPGEVSRARSRRILWIHGEYDWMFPVARARLGYAALLEEGAAVELKLVPDLAHAWPRDENSTILSWFEPMLSLER